MTNSLLVTSALLLLFSLTFCNPTNTTGVDDLTPPVILIVKTDSIILVEDINGKTCVINTTDKINYRISFLKIGDTLKLK